MPKNFLAILLLILIYISSIQAVPRDSRQAGVGCRLLKTILTCNGSAIQCETVANYDGLNNETYQMFGIEALNSTDLKLRYKLYPKNLTDSLFYDSLVTTQNGTRADLVLYHSDVLIEPGLMVKDKECYAKLVNYFVLTNIRIAIEKMSKSSTSSTFILGYILSV